VIVDANVLLYARNADDPRHEPARAWLTRALNGETRVGLAWQSLTAFLRIATHARVFSAPSTPDQVWQQGEEWLAAPRAWVPGPTPQYATVLGRLVTTRQVQGSLVTDAQLAALAIDHGVALVSTDADFARFDEVRWVNPLR
jgi:toxin-antitoxin system PIN domain toxin